MYQSDFEKQLSERTKFSVCRCMCLAFAFNGKLRVAPIACLKALPTQAKYLHILCENSIARRELYSGGILASLEKNSKHKRTPGSLAHK